MKIFYFHFNKKHLAIASLIIIIVIFLCIINDNEILQVSNLSGENPIYRGNESISQVAFACNVVWGTEYIPSMLNIFREHDIKITFFIGGEWARDNPELLRRIVEEGHELGNHGFSHKHHNSLSLEENIKEIKDTEDIIKSITGVSTCLFAPPYGEFNKTTLRAASSVGYKTIMWSIDTIDWRGDGIDPIINRVLKNPHNGAFILMHPTDHTVAALPTIIKGLKKEGYKIGTISELL